MTLLPSSLGGVGVRQLARVSMEKAGRKHMNGYASLCFRHLSWNDPRLWITLRASQRSLTSALSHWSDKACISEPTIHRTPVRQARFRVWRPRPSSKEAPSSFQPDISGLAALLMPRIRSNDPMGPERPRRAWRTEVSTIRYFRIDRKSVV